MRPQALPRPPSDRSLSVLIVCDHASATSGGEAILPLHHFRLLRDRGLEVRLVAHSRTRRELERLFPGENRIHYVEESPLDRWMWRIGRHLSRNLHYLTTSLVSRLSVQMAARRLVRRLVAEHRIDVVHQPTPVSPREPSLLYDVGAPVVIGPMNGGMHFPRAFRRRWPGADAAWLLVGHTAAPLLNRLMPGKRRAARLLVANERTRAVLPAGLRGRAEFMVENGVELDLWAPAALPEREPDAPVTFAFVGRLISLKAVDLLLEALAIARIRHPIRLVIIGEGSCRAALERQSARLFGRDAIASGTDSASAVVCFAGQLLQSDCALRLAEVDGLVMPSLHDCGGAVVLEAMAMALPVIATAWGGPLDYLDTSCGVLVPPSGRQALIDGLAAAMVRLAVSPEHRRTIGRAGLARARQLYDWNAKSDRMIEVFREVVAESERAASASAPSGDSSAAAQHNSGRGLSSPFSVPLA